ncbi:hypothetical protein P6144_01350 [Sphingomonas sp. HITSZ_GF]|uniref:hypothetical protein n=1 Tax=Sphingomonas sp. HITSZ_GF TaxID=3037247 RepID=UPI00240DCFAA|nr:hypothetical protein [Sphingomonas sp. HITSZ_GF]MDG2532281.1 hypothetical protein [Sphingomonas sp. HITSZ_GF]
MRMLRLALPLLLIAPASAFACSVQQGYHLPGNVELIEKADLVVLARVEGDGPDFTVRLRPEKALKGRIPRQPLTALGSTQGRGERAYPQVVTPLDRPHPSAMWGACVRQAYGEGGLVLALYKHTDKGYVPLAYPFARGIEDVRAADDLWPRAARLYIAALARPDPKRALADLAGKLGAKDDADSQAIARDIRAYLEPPSD